MEKNLAKVKEQVKKETEIDSLSALREHLKEQEGKIEFVHGSGRKKSEGQKRWEHLDELCVRWEKYEVWEKTATTSLKRIWMPHSCG